MTTKHFMVELSRVWRDHNSGTGCGVDRKRESRPAPSRCSSAACPPAVMSGRCQLYVDPDKLTVSTFIPAKASAEAPLYRVRGSAGREGMGVPLVLRVLVKPLLEGSKGLGLRV